METKGGRIRTECEPKRIETEPNGNQRRAGQGRNGTEWEPKGSKQSRMRTTVNRNRTEWKPMAVEA